MIRHVISSCHVPRVLGGLYQDVVRGSIVALLGEAAGPDKEDVIGR